MAIGEHEWRMTATRPSATAERAEFTRRTPGTEGHLDWMRVTGCQRWLVRGPEL